MTGDPQPPSLPREAWSEVVRTLDAPLFHMGNTTFTAATLQLLALTLAALFWLAGRLRAWVIAGRFGMRTADAGVRWAVGSIARYVMIVVGLLAILGASASGWTRSRWSREPWAWASGSACSR